MSSEELVYESNHGVPVKLYGKNMGSYTAHRLEFGGNLGGVVVIAKDSTRDKYCLVRHYRPSVDETLLEFPRGLCDEGESPDQAAKREFFEETGFHLENTAVLGSYWGDTAIYPTRITVIGGVASVEASGELDGEIDSIQWVSSSELLDYANREFNDGHSLAALGAALSRGFVNQ